MHARYTVGIDLGTSHTVVAYAALDAAPGTTPGTAPEVRLLDIPQAVGPGEVQALPLLPSVRYHPGAGELDAQDLTPPLPLPDGVDAALRQAPPAVLGRYARSLGAQVPGRLVASAKSWLSYAGVDRSAPILPWGAPEDVAKVSPVLASAGTLAQVHAAWNARFPEAPLAAQDLVLTVPASFDEGARALTVEAARLAGLSRLRLLEEPQAALHDWLLRHHTDLHSALGDARRVLVCDIGGGTTDLTLVEVTPDPGGGPPQLTRIGVGEHLMLGGDNMDLALAHRLEAQLLDAGSERLSAARFGQLVQRCREAKEALLAPDAPASWPLTLLGGGGRLLGGARTVPLARDEVRAWVLDGFFPRIAATERPHKRRTGLVALGLPYPQDAAITRHLAAFLAAHGASPDGATDARWPDTLLLNGGVFHAQALGERLAEVLGAWRGAPVRLLHNDAPDLAVARGAVAYALLRAGRVAGLGRGIGGGAARSHFLVLEEARPARDGQPARPALGICILPRGTEDSLDVALPERRFALRLGQAVRFPLASSAADQPWQAGDLVDLVDTDGEPFVRLPPMATRLPAPEGRQRAEVQVQLCSRITEVGTLELECRQVDDPARRWTLAFELRGQPEESATADDATAPAHPRLQGAIALLDQVFGNTGDKPDPKAVRQLRAQLERLLGRREDWDLPLLRALFDALWARAKRRRRSPEHERAWCNLAGFCLRPGFGAPLDAWRVEQLWTLFPQGLQFPGESANWSEWWTLWRRAAGGLPEDAQLQLLESLAGQLEDIDNALRARKPAAGSYDDMLRLLAALERLPVEHRSDTGQWLLQRLANPREKPLAWWVLGRLGSRVPLYGSAHQVVPAEQATDWAQALLALDWKAVDTAAFAATQIARCSGDRARDLPDALCSAIAQRLDAAKAPPAWAAMVREVVELDESDQRRSFGEALPPGLKLLRGPA